jgi:hypothetical protein
MLAGTVMAKYILHDLLASTEAPMHELSTAHVVALEVPPVVTTKFEHDLLNFVNKLLALHVTLLAVVQPSLRRKTNKSLWVHKWNRLPQVPFKFYQTCSCKTGNQVPGCHLTYYVGSSRAISTYACEHVPTLSTSPQAGVESLGATLKYLCSLLLVGYGSTAFEHVASHTGTSDCEYQLPPCRVFGQSKGSANTKLSCALLGWRYVYRSPSSIPNRFESKRESQEESRQRSWH